MRLVQGDCLATLDAWVPSASLDVVVTSPPYNRGIDYGAYEDRRPRDDYLAWMGRVGRRIGEALAPAGSFFLNLGASPSDPWLPFDVARAAGASLVLQNVIHWVKSIAIDREDAGRASGLTRDLALGHYKPLRSTRFLHGAHEYIFHFTHRGDVPIDRLAIGVPYQDTSNVTRWPAAASGLRCRGNTWFLPYRTIRSAARDRPHPASFPVALPERCLRLHGTSRIRSVFDPFVGIGPTGVAAARLGLPFLGSDVDADYLRVARDAIATALAPPGRRRGNAGRAGPRP